MGAQAAQQCAAVLHVVQALSAHVDLQPRLWLLTREAQAVSSRTSDVEPIQSSVWGLGRVVTREYPEYRCTCVDVGTATPAPEGLVDEFISSSDESEVVFSEGERHVPRLRQVITQPHPSEETELSIGQRGLLDTLSLTPLRQRSPLGRDEVEIAVTATGLNFRDVMSALGTYPGPPRPLGCECAGRVTRIGEAITDIDVGDEVMALAEAGFASRVNVHSSAVVKVPTGLTLADAAAVPVVFATAHYGLHGLARVAAGQRVLIHAAAGGVGMAAIQIARAAGAEVYATASPRKWEAIIS